MSTETREDVIARWELMGLIDRNCRGCDEFFAKAEGPHKVFAPPHKASANCESGKQAHCTCDRCF